MQSMCTHCDAWCPVLYKYSYLLTYLLTSSQPMTEHSFCRSRRSSGASASSSATTSRAEINYASSPTTDRHGNLRPIRTRAVPLRGRPGPARWRRWIGPATLPKGERSIHADNTCVRRTRCRTGRTRDDFNGPTDWRNYGRFTPADATQLDRRVG